MMLETLKKVVELTQGTLRAGTKITPNGLFLAPMAPKGRLKNRKKSKLGQTKKYTSRNTPNDARNIKKGGWIDRGDPEGQNEYHTKWVISRPDSPYGDSKKRQKIKIGPNQKKLPLEIPRLMLDTSKQVVELIQGTLRAGMNITPNRPFLALKAPEGRLKNAKNQNWAKQKIYL